VVTRLLLLGIALLAAAGAWRLARWYWRPRLVLPADLHVEREASGPRAYLDVVNAGAGRSRSCRALLVRCERREELGWLRVEAPRPGRDEEGAALARSGDPEAAGVVIPAGSSVRLLLDRPLPDVPGTYRLDVAVLNGEEKRASYVVEVEAVPRGT